MRPRVLVIDDEPAILSVLAELLTAEGCECETADGGRAGLEKFARFKPALVFSDLRMPEVDGLEVLEHVRQQDPDGVVVLVSAYGDMAQLTRAVQLGAFDFVAKPFEIDAVAAVLRRALEHQRVLAQRRRMADNAQRVERFGRRVNSVHSLDDLFTWAKAALADALGVPVFSLYLYDAPERRLRLACTNDARTTGEAVGLGARLHPPWQGAFDADGIQLRDDLFAFARSVAARRGGEPVAGATLPLLVRDAFVGLVSFEAGLAASEASFDAGALAFLSIAADHLASAIAVRQETAQLSQALAELEATQQDLIQSQKLAAMTKLVAGVAHEIKNPLTSMYFAAVNLTDALAGFSSQGVDTAKAQRFVATLQRDIERLRTRVRDFMMFARPKRVEWERCRVASILADATDQVAPRCEAADVSLDVSVSEDVPVVRVDPKGFLQAVLNLLVNAIEVSPPASSVTVAARRSGDALTVTVADAGPGIDSDIVDHIFDLFFTTKAKGSGVGLSQVHVFCDTHGGKVTFERLDDRTVFTMHLPAAREV